MIRLYLLRHAKSSWDDPGLADHERPLNPRGLEAAPFMGRLMRERGLIPEMIISSTAVRAAETARLVVDAAGFGGEIVFDERVYEASPLRLLSILSEIPSGIGNVMLVGHNPGMEGTLASLTGEVERMPTAALAVIEFDIDDWSGVGRDRGRLEFLLRPKEEMRRSAN